jgi:hypothetical protein
MEENNIVLEEPVEKQEVDLVYLSDIDYLNAACSALDAIEIHNPMTKSGQARQASAKRKCLAIIYQCIDVMYKDVFHKEIEEE